MRSSRSTLALLTGSELGKVAVVVALPVDMLSASRRAIRTESAQSRARIHLVVEDLALAALGFGDQAIVEHIEHILADLLELQLNLLTVLADDADVLVRALCLLLLLNAGDDSPGGTTSADHVLVGDGKEVALVDGKLTVKLQCHS